MLRRGAVPVPFVGRRINGVTGVDGADDGLAA